MAEDIEEKVIATNLVTDPRLTDVFASATGVDQQKRSTGTGLVLTLNTGQTDGYVNPWYGQPDMDCVGVVLTQPADGLDPVGGSSIGMADNSRLVWLRGGKTGYAHAMVVRMDKPEQARLHVPADGKPLTVLKVGLFDMDSWQQMQSRGIIYFDGAGIVQAGADGYVLPPATTSTLGGVIVGDGLSVTADGVLSVLKQEIPVATADKTGVVKPGKGVSVSADGTMNVRLGDNMVFDENGALSSIQPDAPDMSDYYTRTQVDQKLTSYYTKELADATFQKKDSGGTGGGGGGEETPSTEKNDLVFKSGSLDFNNTLTDKAIMASTNVPEDGYYLILWEGRLGGAPGNGTTSCSVLCTAGGKTMGSQCTIAVGGDGSTSGGAQSCTGFMTVSLKKGNTIEWAWQTTKEGGTFSGSRWMIVRLGTGEAS